MFLVQDLKGLGYEKGKPVGLVGVTELSDAQKKQLKEQQEVRPGGMQAGSTGAGGVLSPTLAGGGLSEPVCGARWTPPSGERPLVR